MKRVAILISGSGSNMVRLVEALRGSDGLGEPVLVLSNVPTAGGLRRADELGLETRVVDHRAYGKNRGLFEATLSTVLQRYHPDLICLAGFMRILKAGLVSEYSGRMLNLHPSLLPKYRGLNTHARAIDAGDEEHGCSVHVVTPELDDGPILGQGIVPIYRNDTPASLASRVQEMEHQLFPEVVLRHLSGTKTPLLLR